MVEIKLENNQSGYDVIGEYLRRYWNRNFYDTVIVSLATSYNGQKYSLLKEIASPYNYDDIEFLNDWWEGEKYIKLFGIKSIQDVDVNGGIYMEDK